MKCSFVVDEDNNLCGEEAAKYLGIYLCRDHEAWFRHTRISGATAAQSAKKHGLGSFPGYCYFVLLPTGEIKIGCSNTVDLLYGRFRSIHKKYQGPLVPLAVSVGGFVAEYMYHREFSDFWVSDENYRYSPEMASRVHAVGFAPGTAEAVVKYQTWCGKQVQLV